MRAAPDGAAGSRTLALRRFKRASPVRRRKLSHAWFEELATIYRESIGFLDVVRIFFITGQIACRAFVTIIDDNQAATSLAAGRLSEIPELRAVQR